MPDLQGQLFIFRQYTYFIFTTKCRICFVGDLETDVGVRKPFLSRFVNWEGLSNQRQCHGKYVRSVCVFGVGDLSLLARRPEFFTNKFHTDYQEAALLCMDQLIYNRTRDEYYQRLGFDLQYYEKLPHIRNIIDVWKCDKEYLDFFFVFCKLLLMTMMECV